MKAIGSRDSQFHHVTLKTRVSFCDGPPGTVSACLCGFSGGCLRVCDRLVWVLFRWGWACYGLRVVVRLVFLRGCGDTGKSPEMRHASGCVGKGRKRKFPWKQPRRPQQLGLRSWLLRHSQCCFQACSWQRHRVQTRRPRQLVLMASHSPQMQRTAFKLQLSRLLIIQTRVMRVS